MIELKRILVPVDGSESSDKAVVKAVELAELCNAEIDFIYVSHLSDETDSKSAHILWLPESVAGSVKKISQAILSNAVRQVPEGVRYQTYTKYGIPAEAILAFSEEVKSDLIVLGARGLGFLDGFLLGSVSKFLLEHARCPVMVLK
ncbi:universal stress protein [Anaerosinus massiliensis]|uniref:universal stress protein n=1 Tax=Massilibacillus massiliensis TaxID=1806837 RepID=UPI000DA5EC52|nr:universal stress protein [Massilibacillus massiliensis]